MKVLHCITSLMVGGAESMLFNYLRKEIETQSPIEHVVIYFKPGPNVANIAALGIVTIHISGIIPYDPLFCIRLYATIKREQPDLIHAALWSANIISLLIGKLLRIPVICDLHSDVQHHGAFRNSIERLIAPLADQLIAVSPSVKTSFTYHILKQPDSKKITVIENGIDVLQFQQQLIATPTIKAQFGFLPDDYIIGTVGRQVAIKNQALLLHAFSLLFPQLNPKQQKKLKLCLIGDGPEQESLKKLSKTLHINNSVHFLGTQLVQPMYHLFDIFVLSSFSEGLSIALLEAIAAGIPIISTAPISGHDLLIHEKNALLISYHSTPHELATNLFKLSTNPVLQESLKSGLQDLLHKIDLKTTVTKYRQLYTAIQK